MGAVGVVALAVVGLALMWAINLLYGRRGLDEYDVVRQIMVGVAWGLIFLGGLGVLFGLGGWLGVGVWITALVLWLFGLREHWNFQKRTLFLCLAAAIRGGVPLGRAARGYALESRGDLASRARRLADLLDSGVPFLEALRGAGIRLPLEVELTYVSLRENSGDPEKVLHDFAKRRFLRGFWETLGNQLAYLTLIVYFIPALSTFLILKIYPALAQISAEFGDESAAIIPVLNLPIGDAPWRAMVLAGFSWAGLQMVLVLALLIGVLAEILSWDPPFVRRLWSRYHGAMVLTSMVPAIERGRPLPESIHELARSYPRGHVREDLREVAAHVDGGSSWTEALRREGLIGRADAALLNAAERVGNLTWAMRETAESMVRRLAYRLRTWANIVFVVVILLAALVVVFMATSVIAPLARFTLATTP